MDVWCGWVVSCGMLSLLICNFFLLWIARTPDPKDERRVLLTALNYKYNRILFLFHKLGSFWPKKVRRHFKDDPERDLLSGIFLAHWLLHKPDKGEICDEQRNWIYFCHESINLEIKSAIFEIFKFLAILKIHEFI